VTHLSLQLGKIGRRSGGWSAPYGISPLFTVFGWGAASTRPI